MRAWHGGYRCGWDGAQLFGGGAVAPAKGCARPWGEQGPPGPEPGLGAAAVPEQVAAGICIAWKGNSSKKRYPKLFEHLRG